MTNQEAWETKARLAKNGLSDTAIYGPAAPRPITALPDPDEPGYFVVAWLAGKSRRFDEVTQVEEFCTHIAGMVEG